MHRKKSFLIIAVCLIIILVSTAGCGAKKRKSEQAADTGQPKSGGVLRCALLDDPASLDPAGFNEELGIEVGKEIFDGLVDFDFRTGRIVPAHAEKWDNKDNRVFTFYLRKGTKFHNGKEVTAEDFRYSLDRLLKRDTAAKVGWLLENVEGAAARMSGQAKETGGIKVIDKYTLEITLAKPDPGFLSKLAYPGAAVVDKETVEKAGEAFRSTGAKPEIIVGSGPFKLRQWLPKNVIRLGRNDDYYGRKAYLDGVEFRVIPSETTTLNEFRAGTLDFTDRVPPGQGSLVEKEFAGQVIRNGMWDIVFYGFNLAKPPLQGNVKLRQALNYAVDREGIIKAVLEGRGVPAGGILPPGMAEYNKDLAGYTYDPAKAAALLTEAGYPKGQGLSEIELSYNNNRETNQTIAEAVQAQLKAVGVRIRLKGLPLPEYKQEVWTGKAGFFRLSWSADAMDAGSILYPLFNSRAEANLFHYANPEVDRLLEQARATTGQEERTGIYRTAEQKIVEDAPAVWLFHSVTLYLRGKNVHGIRENPMDLVPLNEVWISG